MVIDLQMYRTSQKKQVKRYDVSEEGDQEDGR